MGQPPHGRAARVWSFPLSLELSAERLEFAAEFGAFSEVLERSAKFGAFSEVLEISAEFGAFRASLPERHSRVYSVFVCVFVSAGRGRAAGYSSAIQDHRQLMHSSGGRSWGRWGDGGDGGGDGGDDSNSCAMAAMAVAEGADGVQRLDSGGDGGG